MPRVYLSLGSNIEPQRHISNALWALEHHFGALEVSPVYESIAVGFEGDHFYNLVVALDTGLDVGELARLLHAIEEDNGRRRAGPKFSSRSLDIDILTYGGQVGEVSGVNLPRKEITRYAFVLRPLADIAADQRHPATGESYGALWRDYQIRYPEALNLWPIDFRRSD